MERDHVRRSELRRAAWRPSRSRARREGTRGCRRRRRGSRPARRSAKASSQRWPPASARYVVSTGKRRPGQSMCAAGPAGSSSGDECGHPIGVERGGHEQHGEVASGAARLEQQCQCEIGVDRALVELVEDHQPRVTEQRVGLERPREQRLGHHLEPGLGPHPRRRTDPVARAPAEGLAEQLADAGGHGRRGEASGLQHADLPSTQPGPVEEPGGHQGGFPAPGSAVSTQRRRRSSASSMRGRNGTRGRPVAERSTVRLGDVRPWRGLRRGDDHRRAWGRHGERDGHRHDRCSRRREGRRCGRRRCGRRSRGRRSRGRRGRGRRGRAASLGWGSDRDGRHGGRGRFSWLGQSRASDGQQIFPCGLGRVERSLGCHGERFARRDIGSDMPLAGHGGGGVGHRGGGVGHRGRGVRHGGRGVRYGGRGVRYGGCGVGHGGRGIGHGGRGVGHRCGAWQRDGDATSRFHGRLDHHRGIRGTQGQHLHAATILEHPDLDVSSFPSTELYCLFRHLDGVVRGDASTDHVQAVGAWPHLGEGETTVRPRHPAPESRRIRDLNDNAAEAADEDPFGRGFVDARRSRIPLRVPGSRTR